jgi:hypothetical protein
MKQNISVELISQGEYDPIEHSIPKSQLNPSGDKGYKSVPLYIPLSHL